MGLVQVWGVWNDVGMVGMGCVYMWGMGILWGCMWGVGMVWVGCVGECGWVHVGQRGMCGGVRGVCDSVACVCKYSQGVHVGWGVECRCMWLWKERPWEWRVTHRS